MFCICSLVHIQSHNIIRFWEFCNIKPESFKGRKGIHSGSRRHGNGEVMEKWRWSCSVVSRCHHGPFLPSLLPSLPLISSPSLVLLLSPSFITRLTLFNVLHYAGSLSLTLIVCVVRLVSEEYICKKRYTIVEMRGAISISCTFTLD